MYSGLSPFIQSYASHFLQLKQSLLQDVPEGTEKAGKKIKGVEWQGNEEMQGGRTLVFSVWFCFGFALINTAPYHLSESVLTTKQSKYLGPNLFIICISFLFQLKSRESRSRTPLTHRRNCILSLQTYLAQLMGLLSPLSESGLWPCPEHSADTGIQPCPCLSRSGMAGSHRLKGGGSSVRHRHSLHLPPALGPTCQPTSLFDSSVFSATFCSRS